MRRFHFLILSVVLVFSGLPSAYSVTKPVLINSYMSVTDWKNIGDTVYAVPSREGKSPLNGMFVFEGEIPSGSKSFVSIWQAKVNTKPSQILKSNKINTEIQVNGARFAVKFGTSTIPIRGEGNYIALLTILDSSNQEVTVEQTSFSLNHSLSAACVIPGMLTLTVRDSSKAFLSLVNIGAKTINKLVSKVVPKKLGPAKRVALLNFLQKANVAGLAASQGLELIDLAEAVAQGENIVVKVIVSDAKMRASNKFKTVEVILSIKDAYDFAQLLSNQGEMNGKEIYNTCSLSREAFSPSLNEVIKSRRIIEEWFGKGWIGFESNCKDILKIANAATSGELKVWSDRKGMRVIALNPSTGTLLTVYASENSGDPLPVFTGPSSTKGKWIGFDDFWDMADASAEYWAPYYLSYKSRKFICEAWSPPKL
jgi:hypothetical protein